MKQKIKTALAFTKHLLQTGAIKETSRKVELEICRHLPADRPVTVVEFGMGHGNITREILRSLSPDSRLYAFEVNPDFCAHVRKTVQDPRLHIINDSAEHVKQHVQPNVHAVIASIPFSFFSKEKGLSIIQDAYDILGENCFYSQVLYTKFNFKKFETVFEECELVALKGVPTEYVYHCWKRRG